MGMEIIFADTNEEYLERLTHYIKKHFEGVYTMSVCLNKKQLQERLKAGKCDVLCFAPELYDETMDFKQVLLPIVLLDEEVPYPDKFKHTINKYIRISKLMYYINESYEVAEKNKPLVYGVYGPAGGVGTSTIAVAVALSYANLGRKTCYLNLEAINSTGLFFEEKNSEVLEDILEEHGKLDNTFCKQYMRKDRKNGIIYCTNVREGLEHLHLSITELIEEIIENEVATAIIVDLGSNVSAIHKEVFKRADKLFIVTMNANYAAYKLQAFMNEMVDKEKVEVIANQSESIVNVGQVPVAGCIDTLYVKNAIGVCEYIAQNHLIKVVGI